MLYKRIRAGGGLGDSLYLQSVVRHLVAKGEKLEVCTNWEEVFSPLKDKIKLSQFSRENIQIVAHYTQRKNLGTKQFEDSCIQAGIAEKVDLKLDWQRTNNEFVKLMKKSPKPKLAVLIYRDPMGRGDGFATELLPKPEVMDKIISILKQKYTIVQIGNGQQRHNYSGVDLDFANKTTVSEMIDIVSASDAVFGYCSFLVPLAESLNKKALFCWAKKGLKSTTSYINTITPEKILFKKTSHHVVDSWDESYLKEAVYGFMQ